MAKARGPLPRRAGGANGRAGAKACGCACGAAMPNASKCMRARDVLAQRCAPLYKLNRHASRDKHTLQIAEYLLNRTTMSGAGGVPYRVSWWGRATVGSIKR